MDEEAAGGAWREARGLSRKGTFSFPGLSPGAAHAAPGPRREGKGRWHSVLGYCYTTGALKAAIELNPGFVTQKAPVCNGGRRRLPCLLLPVAAQNPPSVAAGGPGATAKRC